MYGQSLLKEIGGKMNKFERTVVQYIKEQQLIAPGDRLLIACSGGVDSMALLQFFYKMQGYLQVHIAAVHVDHMLRGQQSAEDRHFVESFCVQQSIQCFSEAIDIPHILQQHGGNVQAVCRQERYAFFQQVLKRERFTHLVTAHHADDQLETMLMALAKGSKRNLHGIASKRAFQQALLIRPFLMVKKEEIREYLAEHNGTYREDSSNAKLDYMRNRFRHQIVPLLQHENPQAALHAVQLAEQLQQDEQFLMTVAEAKFSQLFRKSEKSCYEVEIAPFQKEPLALQRRLILILLNYLYSDSYTMHSYALIQDILKQFHSQQGSASIHLPEQLIARREYDRIIFERHVQAAALRAQYVTPGQWQRWGNMRLYIGEIDQAATQMDECTARYYFNSSQLVWPLQIRTRQAGDRLQQAGMASSKKVARILIDEKIPSAKRDEWPLLVDAQNEVLAVLGVRVNKMIASVRRPTDDYVMMLQDVYE